MMNPEKDAVVSARISPSLKRKIRSLIDGKDLKTESDVINKALILYIESDECKRRASL